MRIFRIAQSPKKPAKPVAPPQGVNINISCVYCGKPYVTSDEWGMECENRCAEVKAKEMGLDLGSIDQSIASLESRWRKEMGGQE